MILTNCFISDSIRAGYGTAPLDKHSRMTDSHSKQKVHTARQSIIHFIINGDNHFKIIIIPSQAVFKHTKECVVQTSRAVVGNNTNNSNIIHSLIAVAEGDKHNLLVVAQMGLTRRDCWCLHNLISTLINHLQMSAITSSVRPYVDLSQWLLTE